jgi:uncharacterized membrane protein
MRGGADEGSNAVVISATCVALATLVPVALYQTGVIETLPDPPGQIFDSERITMSRAAHPLGVPDAILGLASFGTTLALALLAPRSRTVRRFLGVKLTLDASAAAFNATRQVVSFGKLCSWCTGTAMAAGVAAIAGRRTIRDSFREVVD